MSAYNCLIANSHTAFYFYTAGSNIPCVFWRQDLTMDLKLTLTHHHPTTFPNMKSKLFRLVMTPEVTITMCV